MGIRFIIVLGQALLQNNIPRASLLSRIDIALQLAQNNPNISTQLLLSGGFTGLSTISEAVMMQKYILSQYGNHQYLHKNIKIVLEEDSSNTIENAINCLNLIEENCHQYIQSNHHHHHHHHHLRNTTTNTTTTTTMFDVAVVTNDFHVPRTKCIFETILKMKNPKKFNNNKNNSPTKIFASSSCYCFSYVSSDSFLNRTIYRANITSRPTDINEWSFNERLDLEIQCIKNLHKQFHAYGFNKVYNDDDTDDTDDNPTDDDDDDDDKNANSKGVNNSNDDNNNNSNMNNIKSNNVDNHGILSADMVAMALQEIEELRLHHHHHHHHHH